MVGEVSALQVDVAIIGAGTAGMAAYAAARAHTDSLLLIEGGAYGTTCARIGCMPSKLLIAAANVAHQARHADPFGVLVQGVSVDGAAVLARVRRERDRFVGLVLDSIASITPAHRLQAKVALPLGQVIYESGVPLRHVYFPTTAIVSLLYVMEDGASAEVAVVGNEGIVGVSLFMGGETTCSRSVVQHAGYAYRLKGQSLKNEFLRAEAMQGLLLRYTQALLTQMSQIAVCNRHHSLDQQLCRWLLQSLDRLPSNEMTTTQELISGMLGVRREGVTEAAGNLQRAGLIEYSRGHITVRDRAGLQARSCECYAVVKKEFDRLLPHAISGFSRSSMVAAEDLGTSENSRPPSLRNVLLMRN